MLLRLPPRPGIGRVAVAHGSCRAVSVEIRLLQPDEVSVLDHVAPDVFDNAINPRWSAEFLADPRHQLPLRNMVGPCDTAEVPLVLAPHVDQDGVPVEERPRALDVDLDGLAGGHGPRIGRKQRRP